MSESPDSIFKCVIERDSSTHIYKYLKLDSLDPQTRAILEVDYEWDYQTDPIITPTIIYEWDFLDLLLAKRVTFGAKRVLSIGGGGNSRTHIHLSNSTTDLFILNPGLWDLQTYPEKDRHIEITKIFGMAEDLPFITSSITAIEIPSTLDHVLDPEKVASEAIRILVPRGKIGITLGNQDSWYRYIFNLLRIKFQDNHIHAHSFHFSAKDVENLLINAGFINVQTFGTAYLKLPKFLEKRMGQRVTLKIHRFFSNKVLSQVFSRYRGGMFLVIGEKPHHLG